jgi:hypothetical protein
MTVWGLLSVTVATALLPRDMPGPAGPLPAVVAIDDRDVQGRDDDRRARDDERRARDEEQRSREEEQKAREAEQRAREDDRRARDYDRARRAIDEGQWAQALERLQPVIEAAVARSDAALYWRAYALDKIGQRAEALTAIAELGKAYPKSRWLGDARVLEVQVRQRVGQPVTLDAAGDEELKLLALNALQFQSPDQALPMLRQLLASSQSIRLRERALFVLAQSRSPEARAALAEVARQGNPDLARKAIDYLGVHGSSENRELLAELYKSSGEVDVKRRILRAYMVSGDRARVLAAATGETVPELRKEAVRQLGVMGAHDELYTMYQRETTVEVKREILQAMFVGGNSTRLIELAKSEPNADLRRVAVRNLGLMRTSSTGAALVDIYSTQKDAPVRQAAIEGLFVQNNAEALVQLARKETDPAMKKAIVTKLSVMKNPAATAYLIEILGK